MITRKLPLNDWQSLNTTGRLLTPELMYNPKFQIRAEKKSAFLSNSKQLLNRRSGQCFLTATSLLWSSLTPSLKHIYRRSWKSSARYTATTTPASTHACTSSLPQDTHLNPWTWWPWRNWIARWVSPQFSKPLQSARSYFFYLSVSTRNNC